MSLAYDFDFKKNAASICYKYYLKCDSDFYEERCKMISVNIALEIKTPATMSMELVTWAVILATRTKLSTRVSDIL